MKKFIVRSFFIPFLIFWGMPADAQYEWAPVGATWHINALGYGSGYGDPNAWKEYYIIESTGDTVVGGYPARKVGDWIMVQDGAKVYVWWADTLRLQYDFSLETGDTVVFQLRHPGETSPYQDGAFVVDHIDTVSVNGHDLRIFYTLGNDPQNPWECYCWPYTYMEKAGSLNTVVEEQAFTTQTADHIEPFIRCYEDDELQWKRPSFTEDCDYTHPSSLDLPLGGKISLSPNPTASVLNLTLDGSFPPWSGIRVNLVRVDGTIVFTSSNGFVHSNLAIPVEGHSPGLYFLQLTDKNGQVLGVEKVVIE